MRMDQLDYELPEALIAQAPPERRDEARLLVLDRATGAIEHAGMRDLPTLLAAGDLLVVNDTRVLPARSARPRELRSLPVRMDQLARGLRGNGRKKGPP